MQEPDMNHLVIGDSSDAVAWVQGSHLNGESKRDLVAFIENFPTLNFVREPDEYLDMVEGRDGVVLPSWLRDMRKVLAFVYPPALVRFTSYDYDCGSFDYVDRIWYHFELGDMSKDDHDLFMQFAGMYPIGSWVESEESYLAVNLADRQDGRIYEFARENVQDDMRDGEASAFGSTDEAFDSYPRMLSKIVELRHADGNSFQALHL
jgi:hypothetical protein